MYNEERKLGFLEAGGRAMSYGRSIFNTTSPYEEEAGKDLCELPLEALQRMTDENFGVRLDSVSTVLSFIRAYITWCRKHGYPTCDDIRGVEIRLEDKIRQRMVASPRHLQTVLDKAFRPVESGTVDCLYRCYFWLAFAGMQDRDIMDVKTDEVNFTTMTVEHGGTFYELYREALPALRMACEATEFVYEHPRYTNSRKRLGGEYLMHGVRSEKMTLNAILSCTKRIMYEHGIALPSGRVRLSGVFYRMYETERAGEPVGFENVVIERLIDKGRIGSSDEYVRTDNAKKIESGLRCDYSYWKRAFAVQ